MRFMGIVMENDKSKKELQLEIERARRRFLNEGRRVQRLSPEPDNEATGAKPRKQRMKMLA